MPLTTLERYRQAYSRHFNIEYLGGSNTIRKQLDILIDIVSNRNEIWKELSLSAESDAELTGLLIAGSHLRSRYPLCVDLRYIVDGYLRIGHPLHLFSTRENDAAVELLIEYNRTVSGVLYRKKLPFELHYEIKRMLGWNPIKNVVDVPRYNARVRQINEKTRPR